MRTTVTLDADVEQALQRVMRASRTNFKAALNDALRRGLKGALPKCGAPIKLETKAMGLREGIDPFRLHDLDQDLELEEFRRKTRRLKEARA